MFIQHQGWVIIAVDHSQYIRTCSTVLTLDYCKEHILLGWRTSNIRAFLDIFLPQVPCHYPVPVVGRRRQDETTVGYRMGRRWLEGAMNSVSCGKPYNRVACSVVLCSSFLIGVGRKIPSCTFRLGCIWNQQ